MELGSHTKTSAVGDNFLVVHDHEKPANVYSYYSMNGHKCAQTVDAAV